MRNYPYINNVTIFCFSLIFLCGAIFYNIENTRNIVIESKKTNTNNIINLYLKFVWGKHSNVIAKSEHFQNISYALKPEYEKFLKESVEFFLQFNISKVTLYNYDGSELITTKDLLNQGDPSKTNLVGSLIKIYTNFLLFLGFYTSISEDYALSNAVLGKTTVLLNNREMFSNI